MSKTIVIHQPDFMPWLGFFNKVSKADTFVVLDHVVNNPRDGFWCRRVKVLANKKEHWLSVPLLKSSHELFLPINKMKIKVGERNFEKKHLKTIYQNYSKAPYFSKIIPFIEEYYQSKESNLSKRNMEFIHSILNTLNITPNIIYSSSLNCQKKSTSLLIEIIKKVEGDRYICGQGAKEYQKDNLFKENDIQVIHNNYIPVIYPQINMNKFISGLSIIDTLMNIGVQKAKNLL